MFLKVVPLLMVLAIFNPFCCCTADGFAMDAGVQTPLADGCCQSQPLSNNDSAPVDDSHDINECPHQALKDYHASTSKDLGALHETIQCARVSYALVDIVVASAHACSLPNSEFKTPQHAPPRTLSQVYCIYRI